MTEYPYPTENEDTNVQVPAEGTNRAATVDFSNGSVTIPLPNGNLGIYKPVLDEQGSPTGKVIYSEYTVVDGEGKDVSGTAVKYDDNHPEYANRIDAAKRADAGAYARGSLGKDVAGSAATASDGGYDPYLPYKGSQTIITDSAQVVNISGEDNKIAATNNKVETFLNITDDKWIEILSEINDAQKNKIKEFLQIPYEYTLTIDDLKRYGESEGVAAFTNIRKDGTVRTFQYVNSLQGTTKNRAVSKEMKFNIITGRSSYLQNSDSYIGQDFIVTDRAPLDYIKYLAQQEPWPTVVWQDPRTGEFWYVPRGNDVSGLTDPLRFNRTYFFRQYPDDISKITPGDFPRNNPHMATMLHSFREEESSVSVRTNILVQSQAPKAMTGNKGHYLLISVIPPMYKQGLGRAYAASFFTVTDNTATQNPGALIAVALSYGRTVGKELRAAACTMLGDPSIIPGETIQVVGSPAHQGYTNTKKVSEDRAKFLEMNNEFEGFYSELPEVITGYIPDQPVELGGFVKNVKDQAVKVVTSNAEVSSDKMMKDAAEEVQLLGDNTVKFEPEPPSTWRVEAVIDKFNDGVDGYYTELSLLSCF